MAKLLMTTLITGSLAAIFAGGATADDAADVNFRKITLTREFFSEGADAGDFNHDGKTDVTMGPFWYEGPAFEKRHEFTPAKAYDPNGYSDAFLQFVDDFNRDGWDDILVIGWPGKEVYWYENPKGDDTRWSRHLVHNEVDNESPTLADLTGDDRPELLFHTGGKLGYADIDAANPTAPWTFHAVSEKGPWHKYTHGFGVGDVNGDGRRDLLLSEGWWEQPKDKAAVWKHHPARFANNAAQMYVYDVDGDGDNDVISSLEAHGFGLAWHEQVTGDDGSVSFKQHTIMGSRPEENAQGVKFSQLHALALADVDGDGLQDIITGKRYWAHGPRGDAEPDAPAVLYWFGLVRGDANNVGARFVAHQIDDDSGVGTQVTATDVTGDGKIDVIVGNKKGAFVFVQERP